MFKTFFSPLILQTAHSVKYTVPNRVQWIFDLLSASVH